MDIKTFFTEAQQKSIQQAIANAELNTSGEIRVHIDQQCSDDPVKAAIEIFEKLNMHKTEQRNGVLFYLALDDKKFAVIGDKGINDVVPPDFWDSIKTKMIDEFHHDRFAEGLCGGIEKAGEELKAHFPYQNGDVNELTNDISFEE